MSDSTDAVCPSIGPVTWVAAALGFLYYYPPPVIPLTNPSHHLDPGRAMLFLGPRLVVMLLLVWLRRVPIPAAVSLAGLWLLSPTVSGPAMATQAHVARYRKRIGTAAATCILVMAESVIVLRDASGGPVVWVEVLISAIGVTVVPPIGLFGYSTTNANQQRATAQAAW